MVYLLNSKYSKNQPDSWLCGGVLISTTQILTAAACLTDVSHIYAIAGYKKYVNGQRIEEDECTRSRKKRIVKIIIPKAFSIAVWIQFDIGVGIVETPYQFSDLSYRSVCSYEPGAIMINYDIKYEAMNMAVVAFGWGGTVAREPGLVADINSKYLREAQSFITNISSCQTQFTDVVDYYFLCTNSFRTNASIRRDVDQFEDNMDDCDMRRFNSKDTNNNDCFEGIVLRRQANDPSNINIKSENVSDGNNINSIGQNGNQNDNGGICQNDHGGPLVSTEGSTEKVIGIALNSVYDRNYQCQGPFLYLSTARSSVLIKCLLSSHNDTRKLCDSMKKEIKEFDIQWPDTINIREGDEESDRNLRNRRHKLLAVPSCRTVAHSQSPIPRTLTALNALLDSNPDFDLFGDVWKTILSECMKYCEKNA